MTVNKFGQLLYLISDVGVIGQRIERDINIDEDDKLEYLNVLSAVYDTLSDMRDKEILEVEDSGVAPIYRGIGSSDWSLKSIPF